MDLPQTLHGQLYLLTFDRRRRRFDKDNLWYFGRALRAAMLSDLYLSGAITDRGGRPYPTGDARPTDPMLSAAFTAIGTVGRLNWSQAITPSHETAPQLIAEELQAIGWLRTHRRLAGLFPDRVVPSDAEQVEVLFDRVTVALQDAIDGHDADPRSLALGLLGVNGQLPTVMNLIDATTCRPRLHALTLACGGPILGLRKSIAASLEDYRHQNAASGRYLSY